MRNLLNNDGHSIPSMGKSKPSPIVNSCNDLGNDASLIWWLRPLPMDKSLIKLVRPGHQVDSLVGALSNRQALSIRWLIEII